MHLARQEVLRLSINWANENNLTPVPEKSHEASSIEHFSGEVICRLSSVKFSHEPQQEPEPVEECKEEEEAGD